MAGIIYFLCILCSFQGCQVQSQRGIACNENRSQIGVLTTFTWSTYNFIESSMAVSPGSRMKKVVSRSIGLSFTRNKGGPTCIPERTIVCHLCPWVAHICLPLQQSCSVQLVTKCPPGQGCQNPSPRAKCSPYQVSVRRTGKTWNPLDLSFIQYFM